MTFLGGATIYALAFGAFLTWIAQNAWRTGIIKGGYGKPIRRAKQPRIFAICLVACSIYAAIAWAGAAYCGYTLISN